jgi:hypothetical protein
MAQWNGTQGAIMSAEADQSISPEQNPASSLYVWVMRIWVICALIIVGSGVANFLLCQFLGDVK